MNIESAINNLIEYKVGIYVRLSREDDPKDVSESIKNQKDFLLDYVRKEDKWYLVDIYSDDGYSGTNFDRPDFIRMIKDVEDGKINLVITKDLSRLGRDYIETGHYMERYFPSKRVRYIAVNDGIDTGEKDSSNNEMGAFKSVVNDMYARDISKKVRTAKRTRVEKGLFLGAFAPYGYTKDLNDKNRLVIDKEVSGVIKGIFYEYLSGKTYTEIARDLNNRNIDSPFRYKKRSTKFYCSSNADLWSGNTIKKILTNQTYIGDLVQHKKEVINYKLKKTIDVPKSEYIIVENTHDHIIEKSDFCLVQELIKKKCHGSHSKDINQHLLSGLIYCPRCGGRYSYANKNNKTGEKVVICDRYRRYGNTYCDRIAIKERDINRYVLQNLKEIINQKLNKEKLINSIRLQEKCRGRHPRRPSKRTDREK